MASAAQAGCLRKDDETAVRRARDGSRCAEAAYCDDMSLGASLRKVLRLKALQAEVHFLPPIDSRGLTRRELARAAEAAIRACVPAPNGETQPGAATD